MPCFLSVSHRRLLPFPTRSSDRGGWSRQSTFNNARDYPIMNLVRVKDLKAPDGHPIPALLLTPDVSPRGGSIVIHPYGGTKEQMLAVALSLVEKGIACLLPDLCGHGENHAEIGVGMLEEK